MFNALKGFIDSAFSQVINKEDMISTAENTFSAINKTIIPALKNVKDTPEYFESDRIAIIGNIGHGLGLRTDSPEKVVSELLAFFKEVAKEESNILKLMDDVVVDKIFPSNAAAQDLAILTTMEDITSLTLFMLDLVYYVILDNELTAFPKKRVIVLNQAVTNFTMVAAPYLKGFSKHVKSLAKVTRVEVKADAAPSLMDKLFAKQGSLVSLPGVNGFINNPIYHIRLWAVDRDVEKFEALKEKKKLIELKVLDLQLRKQGKHDDKLAKQIEYYEDKISGIEYDLNELSGDA